MDVDVHLLLIREARIVKLETDHFPFAIFHCFPYVKRQINDKWKIMKMQNERVRFPGLQGRAECESIACLSITSGRSTVGGVK